MRTTAYPSCVLDTPDGPGLFAAETLEEGTVVERLEGPLVPYSKIPEEDLRNAFEVDDGRWVLPQSAARHINHSCDANCYISTNLDVITQRSVPKGAELTIMYNEITLEKYMKAGAVLPPWDQRRGFTCRCGAANCLGRIDRYTVPAPLDPNSRNVRIGVVEGRGRGMFAARRIQKGELVERAPVIPLTEKQWPVASRTILSDYGFDWGENDEQAAIALGYVSIYNHSYSPNAQLEQMPDELMMEVVAITDIQPGEEITINYNGEPESQDPLWFLQRATPRRSRRQKGNSGTVA